MIIMISNSFFKCPDVKTERSHLNKNACPILPKSDLKSDGLFSLFCPVLEPVGRLLIFRTTYLFQLFKQEMDRWMDVICTILRNSIYAPKHFLLCSFNISLVGTTKNGKEKLIKSDILNGNWTESTLGL